MSDTVISVRNLGKKYRLGATLSPDTLRDHIMHAASRLFRRRNGQSPSPGSPLSAPRSDLPSSGSPLSSPGSSPSVPRSPLPAPRSDEFWALKDVSFDVKQGEVLGVIGSNGAGKSTLLKILTRITEPTEGEVRMKGRVASLLEVGTGFHPELSGRENIFMNGAILGMTRAEIKAKFDEIVAFSGVEKFLDTPVKRYSSGMRVRLGFAVAAHLDPEILLVDEVLAVGDAAFQKKCMGKMDEVAKGGRTVLLVSHNMVAIESLCPSSILLSGGAIAFLGETSEAIAAHLSSVNCQFTAEGQRVGTMIRRQDVSGLIRRAVLLNGKGAVTDQIRVGEACKFKVELDSAEVLPDVALGLHIKGAAIRQRVTSFHTRYHGCPTKDLIGRSVWICECPELMLAPGAYVLELAVASAGKIVDRIEQGFYFNVIAADIFSTGKVPPVKDGIFVSKGSWHVTEAVYR